MSEEISTEVEPGTEVEPATASTEVETGTEPVEAEPVDYSWVADLGDEAKVRSAIEFRDKLTTEEGALDYFVEAALELGLSGEQISNLFNPVAPGTEPEEEDDDQRLRRLVTEVIQEQVIQPQTVREQQAATDAVRATLQTTVAELEVPQKAIPAVLALADPYVDPAKQYDPAHIAEAVRKGFADFQEVTAANGAAQVETKTIVRDTTPKPLKGGSPGSEAASEGYEGKGTDALALAKERVRARLREAGQLG